MKRTLSLISLFCILQGAISQGVTFTKVGAYDCDQSQYGTVYVLDGSWINHKVFLCGYRNTDILGSTVKAPWIGCFDLTTGKLLKEQAWECQGPFSKIIANDVTNTVVVSSSQFGQSYNIVFDTNLVDMGNYYSKDYTNNGIFTGIGDKGFWLSIQHKGNLTSDLGMVESQFQFRCLLFNAKMENVFTSNYIDSLCLLSAVTDDYGNVVAFGFKNDGIMGNNGMDIFPTYHMEVFSLKSDQKGISRKSIKWKVPTKQVGDLKYKFVPQQVYKIVDPNSKGAGIVGMINFMNTEYPNDILSGSQYIAYYYLNADGTIDESSIIPLLEKDKYLINYTQIRLINGVLLMATFSKADKTVQLVLYNTRTKAPLKVFPLSQFPEASGAGVNDFRDIDDYGLSLLFNRESNTYEFYQLEIK